MKIASLQGCFALLRKIKVGGGEGCGEEEGGQQLSVSRGRTIKASLKKIVSLPGLNSVIWCITE